MNDKNESIENINLLRKIFINSEKLISVSEKMFYYLFIIYKRLDITGSLCRFRVFN